jgi:hypothetical protein
MRSRKTELLLAVALLLAGSDEASAAYAESATSSLSWVELPGAEECGGAIALSRLVEDHLGRHALVPPSQADLSIEGRVEHLDSPRLWRAHIVLRDASGGQRGSREIESAEADCSELRESVALAMALMIDPDAMQRAAPPIAARVVAPLVAVLETPRADSVPAPPSADRPVPRRDGGSAVLGAAIHPWSAEADAQMGLAYGLLPSAAFGLGIGVTLRPPRFWRVRVLGNAFWPQRLSAEGNGSTRLTLLAAGVAVCPLAFEDAHGVSLELCGGALMGSLGADGAGFGTSHSATSPFVDLAGMATLLVHVISPLSLTAGATFGVAPVRNRVVYEDSGGASQTLYVAPLVNGVGTIGLAVVVP